MNTQILVVDDEESIRKVATRMLEKDNYSVTALKDGKNVLEAINDKSPVVVFLDFKLPGKNGIDILKDIKSQWPSTPVVMVSAFMNSNNAVEASQNGAADYILKPIDWKYLKNIAYLYTTIHNLTSSS